MSRMMRIVVRTPHAISSPTIGVIRHLGPEMEPMPETAQQPRPAKCHPVASWVREGPLLPQHYRPVWQGGSDLISGSSIKSAGARPVTRSKELAEDGTQFVIISFSKEISRWQPPPPYPRSILR